MKKSMIYGIFTLLFLMSCEIQPKKTEEKKMEKKEHPHKFSLAQWSLLKDIHAKKRDPIDRDINRSES